MRTTCVVRLLALCSFFFLLAPRPASALDESNHQRWWAGMEKRGKLQDSSNDDKMAISDDVYDDKQKEGDVNDDVQYIENDERSKLDLGEPPSLSKSYGSHFVHAFIATLSVILVSELGDKTFFIACILAMRHSRSTVLMGAMTALTLMHVMSALFGFVITIIPRYLTFYVSSALFFVFGVKMIRDGYYMSNDEAAEEMEEVQEDLRKRDLADLAETKRDLERGSTSVTSDETSFKGTLNSLLCCSKVFLQAFTLTFLAEWGDRSQLATVILAARETLWGVIIGGILGHALCTSLAVMGGRFIATRISVRSVTLIGGVVFIVFALSAFFIDPNV